MLVTTRTNLPLASSRRALLGTMVSKLALRWPMERLMLVPESMSPVIRKTSSFFCPPLEGSGAMDSRVAVMSLPQ